MSDNLDTREGESHLSTHLAEEQKERLQRTLGRFDLVALLIAAVVGVEVLGQVASFGGEAITWLVLVAVFFLAPYALIFAETGSRFPDEGGPYVWVKVAFGRPIAAISTLLYWVTTPVWISGTMAALAVETWSTFLWHVPTHGVLDYLFRTIFIWLSVSSAMMSLRYGKWLPTVGTIAKVGVLGVFVLTTIVYAIKHGVHGIGFGDLSPTLAGCLGLLPIVLFAYLGFESGNAAGGEMVDAEGDVPSSVLRSAALAVCLYLIPVVALLLVLPQSKITGVSGLMDAVQQVYSVYGGAADAMVKLTAVVFLVVLVGQGAAWMIVSDRTQATTAMDGSFFGGYYGVFSRRLGTPMRVNVLTGLVGTAFMVAAMVIVHGSAAAVFGVVLNICISTYLLSYLAIIPAALVLRRREKDAPGYRLPCSDGTFAAMTYVATAIVAVGSWVTLFPGVLERLFGVHYDFVGDWGVGRPTFELFTLGTLAVLILLGVVGYVRARPVRDDVISREA